MPAEQPSQAGQHIVSDVTAGMCLDPPSFFPGPTHRHIAALPAREAPWTDKKDAPDAAAADVGAADTAAVDAAEQPASANNVPIHGGVASPVPMQTLMPDATDRKRPIDTDVAVDAVLQQPAKRPRRRGKGRKNYAALENGDANSSGEDEGGAAQGRVALRSLRDEDLPRGAADRPQALSKDDKAAQMTLSADRLSVTSRKGYRTVRIMPTKLPCSACPHM